MLRLQLLQTAQPLIKLEVADLRAGIAIVELVVTLEIGAKRLDLVLWRSLLRRHCGLERYRERSTVLSTNPRARSRASRSARKFRRPFTRFRFSATKRMPRGPSQ